MRSPQSVQRVTGWLGSIQYERLRRNPYKSSTKLPLFVRSKILTSLQVPCECSMDTTTTTRTSTWKDSEARGTPPRRFDAEYLRLLSPTSSTCSLAYRLSHFARLGRNRLDDDLLDNRKFAASVSMGTLMMTLMYRPSSRHECCRDGPPTSAFGVAVSSP
jgi:hypothetical protein